MADLESEEPRPRIDEPYVDAAYDRYIENLEKPVSDLSDDDVMKDVLDSFLASKGEASQSLSLPTPEKRLNLYKTLSLGSPTSEGALNFGSQSWYNDPEQGYTLLAPPMNYEEFLKRRYGLDLVDLMAGPPEPRPKDKSKLPAVIDAASVASQLARTQADEPRPKGKGEVFRGIGSLMRRRMFPIIQAAQMGWEALPEDKKKEVQDFLSRPAHELVGMDKPGIEYFKDLIGIEDGEPEPRPKAAGGIRSLSEQPLTGAQRGELLNLYETKTLKSKPRNAVNDLVRNDYWPERLRSEGIEFLEGRAKTQARRRQQSSEVQDYLARRKPGHALAQFEARKTQEAREEAKRSRLAALRRRGEELQRLDKEGFWNKKSVDEIASLVESIETFGVSYVSEAVARATMEAVPRALKKEGWTVRHASKGRDKRRSSRYIVSPDGKFEVRLSNHYLPDTPEREYMRSQTGGPRWDEDIVVSGRESPSSILEEIKELYAESVDEEGTIERKAAGGMVDRPLYDSARII